MEPRADALKAGKVKTPKKMQLNPLLLWPRRKVHTTAGGLVLRDLSLAVPEAQSFQKAVAKTAFFGPQGGQVGPW